MSGAAQQGISTMLRKLGARSAHAVRTVLLDIRCLYFVFRNPGTPWYARALLFLPLAYLCSPIQLIPNFIPVLGQMDDLLVIWMSNKLVRKLVDPRVLQQSRERAARVSFTVAFSGKAFYTKELKEPSDLSAPTNAPTEPADPGADSAPSQQSGRHPAE